MQRLRSFQTLLAALALMLVACEGGEEHFLDCPLDPKVKELGLCTSAVEGVSTAEESCAVTNHPQCPESVCVAWAGSSAFCSQSCASANDCPEGSECLTYAGTTRYCVKASAIPCMDAGDCPAAATCQGADPDANKTGRCTGK